MLNSKEIREKGKMDKKRQKTKSRIVSLNLTMSIFILNVNAVNTFIKR